jgi:diguanylate cyclase
MDFGVGQLAFGALTALGGLSAGWWLRNHWSKAPILRDVDDADLVRELMTSLHRLSLRMADDVDQHQTRVGQVDRELTATRRQSPAALNSLVDRLMAANEDVQAKLSTAEAKLEELTLKIESHATEARTDVLTGMPNRRAFVEEAAKRLAEARDTGTELSLVFVDIDTFKQVNDEFGHPLGDRVLRRVGATLMAASCWQYFLARYGGEEFAILLPDTPLEEARRYGEELRLAVQNARYRAGNTSLGLTISAGVAQLLPSEDMNSLIQRTDKAMYAAKRTGRNRVYWHDGTDTHPCTPTAAAVEPAVSSLTLPLPGTSSGVGALESSPSQDASAAHASNLPTDVDIVEPRNIDLDLLNNLGNKTMFCQHVHRRISEFNRGGAAFSTILLNVDNYRQLAHDHGGSSADLILGVVTQAIRDRVRGMDMVSRYDETTFALILPGAALRNAVCVGERLRKEIHRTAILIDGQPVRFTISLGVVQVTDGDEMATHVERACAQLQQASSGGGNRTGFTAAS